MERREGEGEGEVSEGSDKDIDRALARYSEQIRQKYGEDVGDNEELGGAKREGGAQQTQEGNDKPDSDGDENSASRNPSGASDGEVGEGRRVESQDAQALPSGREESADVEPARVREEQSLEKTSGEDEEESMRKRLNDKYPEDRKETARGDESQQTGQKDHGEGIEVDSSAEKTDESGKEQTSETKTEIPKNEIESSATRNPSAPVENDDSTAKEDVGWKNAEALQEHASKGDSLRSRNQVDQEGNRRPEASDSEAGAKSKDWESPAEQKPAPQGEAEGGGNHRPEHDTPMSAKDMNSGGPKDGDLEGRESGDQSPMVRRASTYMESLALIVPDRVIPEHENRDDVFQVQISRVLRPQEEYKVYMTHKLGYKRAYLPIREIGAQNGEGFYVKKPERYEEGDFARDYNSSKPKGLENTSLWWRDGEVVLKVDGTELALKEARLRAQEGKVVLDAKLNHEDKNAVKIAKGIDGTDFRLKHDHAVVTSMKENKEGLTISYERTHHDEFPHVRLMKIENLRQIEGEKVESWEHRAKLNSEEVRLERSIERTTDSIKIEFSEANARRAWEYWSSATSQSERFYHQGDIGESVARIALEKSGFKTFPKELFEPANIRAYTHESEMRGPDVVVYGNVGGKEGYHICQVKHWREPAKAMKEAREDALKFRDSKEDRLLVERILGKEISGGFMIELKWSYKDSVGIIYSEYMEY